MRITCLLMVVMLSACGGYKSAPGAGEQASYAPGSYGQDGFYDGGINDPDMTAPVLRLPE